MARAIGGRRGDKADKQTKDHARTHTCSEGRGTLTHERAAAGLLLCSARGEREGVGLRGALRLLGS